MNESTKILTVVGPTSSGKSELAVVLAKKFKGEIISCDSRQIYVGMDIGTGKVAGNWKTIPIASHPERVQPTEESLTKPLTVYKARGREKSSPIYIYKSIPHHCIDFVDPKKQYSVAEFQKTANQAMAEIRQRGHLPILCGGTGHWVDAVVYNQKIPGVKPNLKLRKDLEKFSNEELFGKMKHLDPDRAAVIDWHNKRRLVRAMEIILTTGKPVPKINNNHNNNDNLLMLGIYPGQEELDVKIDKRLQERLKQGMIKEVQRLHSGPSPLFSKEGARGSSKTGLSWRRLESFGLEYKFVSLFLQKKLKQDEMVAQLSTAIKQYSKRQMTWFRKNEAICWVQNKQEAEMLVKDFLKS